MFKFNNIGEIGHFLAGLSAILTASFAFLTWIFQKITNTQTSKLIDANTHAVQQILAKQLLKDIDELDPEKYYTLDFKFPTGEFLHIPLVTNKSLTILENIKMTVLSHNEESTLITLTCTGFGTIPEHCHEYTCEEIKILKGTMTCLKTGKRYVAGDVWSIQAKEFHGAYLHNCVAILIHKPPLPTAYERPVNLIAMNKIFKED